jgi:FSR family fosmidomycin resistance protein-like MFS transporter
VFEEFRTFFREMDQRVKVTIAGIGIQNWSQSLTGQYNTLYARDLGANPVALGVLNSINTAVSSIVSVPVGWATERYSMKKVMLLGLSCVFISVVIYALAGNWWLLIPAIILGILVRLSPLTDIILVNYTKPEQSGTVMGLSRTIWAVPAIFAPITAAVVVGSFGGINAQGIRPLYVIQLALTLFVFFFMAAKLPTLQSQEKGKAQSRRSDFVQDFRELFKGEKALKRWIVIWIIASFGWRVSGPFVPLWMVEVKGATPYILGLTGTVSSIISVFLPVFAGRLADRIGRKRAYYVLSPFSYVGTILLIVAPSPEYLMLYGLLQGIGQASFIPFVTMHWEIVPEEKRGRWYGIEGFINIFAIPAALLGGILWQQGFMKEVLFLPIMLQVLVAIPIMITVPETLKRDNTRGSKEMTIR